MVCTMLVGVVKTPENELRLGIMTSDLGESYFDVAYIKILNPITYDVLGIVIDKLYGDNSLKYQF